MSYLIFGLDSVIIIIIIKVSTGLTHNCLLNFNFCLFVAYLKLENDGNSSQWVSLYGEKRDCANGKVG